MVATNDDIINKLDELIRLQKKIYGVFETDTKITSEIVERTK